MALVPSVTFGYPAKFTLIQISLTSVEKKSCRGAWGVPEGVKVKFLMSVGLSTKEILAETSHCQLISHRSKNAARRTIGVMCARDPDKSISERERSWCSRNIETAYGGIQSAARQFGWYARLTTWSDSSRSLSRWVNPRINNETELLTSLTPRLGGKFRMKWAVATPEGHKSKMGGSSTRVMKTNRQGQAEKIHA